MRSSLLCLIIVTMAVPGFAGTFRVERDGSTDFSVIQDAVNAAASGDTILIGPGRYNEGEIVSTAGWTEFVRVLVHQDELTIIGAGADETILGSTVDYDYDIQGDDRGIVAGPYFGSNNLRVENIGFENMGRGIWGCGSPDIVVVENCRFDSNYYGVYLCSGNSLELNSCVFNLAAEWGVLFSCNGLDNVSVNNCEFVYEEDPFYSGILVHMQGVSNADFNNCTFSEGKWGLRLYGGSTNQASVTGCQFFGQARVGLEAGGVNVFVDNCVFEQQEIAFVTYMPAPSLNVCNTTIVDVNDVSFEIYSVNEFEVSNTVIAHGPEHSVRQHEFQSDKTNLELHQLIMINNDWGTTDADTIASWISLRDYEAQYIPFIGQQVPAEAITLDGLKAMFR